jgi:hypothetical protein
MRYISCPSPEVEFCFRRNSRFCSGFGYGQNCVMLDIFSGLGIEVVA